MTLNGYFMLKTVFSSASNELACSSFQTKLRKLAELYAYTVSGKM